MMKEYLDAAVQQGLERAKVLKGKIRNPLPSAELSGLQRVCEERLDEAIRTFKYLYEDSSFMNGKAMQERIRLFRRGMEDLAFLEATGIAALNRVGEDDVFLNKILFEIHREINYPLLHPTVSCLSHDYYSINTSLGLLSVPLAESDFLLHLPDLYHELGHPLISTQNNPKVQAFQDEYAKFLSVVIDHFNRERVDNIRSTGPKEYFGYVFDTLEAWWIMFWSAELFCDLFATYTLGTAYAWSHFHLTATQKTDPYGVRFDRTMSHPPDGARMETILYGLDIIKKQEDVGFVKTRWEELADAIGAKPTVHYRMACPKELLQQAAIHAFEGTKGIGCRITGNNDSSHVNELLNRAWEEFWTNPKQYHLTERKHVEELRQKYTV